MIANNGIGNIAARDAWQTPENLFCRLNNQYKFISDCCASSENNKCALYSNHFESLSSVPEPAWMNPPFSKATEMFQHFFKVVKCGVAIYRCDNLETRVWQELIFAGADWIHFIGRRVHYIDPFNPGARGQARFPSALIGVGVDAPNSIDGRTLR